MHNLQTTELKLKTTPTGGVDASHSPYYRRLLSAGYKGYLQGSIGGGALYGTFGLVVGALVAGAMFLGGWVGPVAALTLLPVAGGLGMIKGAYTFGQIGSTAAINAESADLSEQRRYLLDRYYDLPEGPEGEREAEAIKQELLKRQMDEQKAPSFFHWKTLLIGALVGAAIALVAFSPSGLGLLANSADLVHIVDVLGLGKLFGAAAGATTISAGAITAAGTAFGALAGALAGATIGIDRYYIRKWFDHTEGVVHSGSHKDYGLMERHEQVQRLKQAAQEDEKTKLKLASTAEGIPAVQEAAPKEPPTPAPKPVASLNAAPAPGTKVSAATLQRRVAELQAAHLLEI